jgi:hypothetical protein
MIRASRLRSLSPQKLLARRERRRGGAPLTVSPLTEPPPAIPAASAHWSIVSHRSNGEAFPKRSNVLSPAPRNNRWRLGSGSSKKSKEPETGSRANSTLSRPSAVPSSGASQSARRRTCWLPPANGSKLSPSCEQGNGERETASLSGTRLKGEVQGRQGEEGNAAHPLPRVRPTDLDRRRRVRPRGQTN